MSEILNLREVMSHSNKEFFTWAMEKEVYSLDLNDVWNLVSRSSVLLHQRILHGK